MDSLRRGIPTTSSTNKQKFLEDANENRAVFARKRSIHRSSSNSSEQQQEEKKDEKNEQNNKKTKTKRFFGHILIQTVRANCRYHFSRIFDLRADRF